jgi:hypothetical protein
VSTVVVGLAGSAVAYYVLSLIREQRPVHAPAVAGAR